jgi:serine/threonine-protein kinase HipA
MSAMTLLEQRDGETADYVDVAERLTQVSVSATDDAEQLFRRVALSVGLNNTDDHLRNHGFLRRRGGWTLSPAFDVNPNPEPELRQTTIAGADLPGDETEGLLELARTCRLAPGRARSVCVEVAAAIDGWRDSAVRNGVKESELDQFESSFTAGLRTLRGV